MTDSLPSLVQVPRGHPGVKSFGLLHCVSPLRVTPGCPRSVWAFKKARNLFSPLTLAEGGKGAGVLGSQREYFVPLALQGADAFQLSELNRGAVVQGHVRAQEVVVGYKQDGDSDGAVAGGKAAGRAHVVLVGTVESFDQLLEGAILRGDVIEVLQSEDL